MTIKDAAKQLESLRRERRDTARVDEEFAAADAQALDVALSVLAGHEPDSSSSATKANEALAERLWDDDRRLFARNLGWLLSQTRCGVVSCELYGDQDREYVIARYDHGGKREIDVTADSYLAIIKDVTKRV